MSESASETRIDTLEKFHAFADPIFGQKFVADHLYGANFGGRALPQKVTSDNFWVFREALRLRQGIYNNFDFPGFNVLEIYPHFLHMSVEDPYSVAYTADPEHGLKDKQTKLSLGRYLTKHALMLGNLTEDRIRQNVELLKARTRTDNMKLATTAEEITRVYLSGPHSCMKKPPKRHGEAGFVTHVHPCTIYADHEHLRLYYLEDDLGTIIARALVREDTKQFIRLYGDEMIRYKLAVLGYRTVGNFLGLTLPMIPLQRPDGTTVNDAWLMPYIDDQVPPGYAAVMAVEEQGRWAIKSMRPAPPPNSLQCTTTGGFISPLYSVNDLVRNQGVQWPSYVAPREPEIRAEQDTSEHECARCEEFFERHEMTEVYDGDLVCSVCLDADYSLGWVARDQEEWILDNYSRVDVNGNAYTEEYFNECCVELTHDAYSQLDHRFARRSRTCTTVDGDVALVDECYTLRDGSRIYHEDDRVVNVHGYYFNNENPASIVDAFYVIGAQLSVEHRPGSIRLETWLRRNSPLDPQGISEHFNILLEVAESLIQYIADLSPQPETEQHDAALA
jgi:flagellar biosynthesis regulator FlaF